MAGRRAGPVSVLIGLAGLAALAFGLHLAVGSVNLTLAEVWRALVAPDDSTSTLIVRELRIIRALTALVSGALLGMVGSAFQAYFRNPLADPYVVGVSSGAAVGGALAIVLGVGTAWEGWASGLGPLAFATLTGMATLGLVVSLSVRRGLLDSATLLLTGVVVSSLLSALLSLILLWGGKDTNVVLGWLLGHLTPAYWNRLHLMLLVLAIGGPLLILQGKRLNALSLGDETARRLGVDTRKLKPIVLGAGACMVAVCVGSIGIIGFLGLVAPHIARRLVGVDWRWSLAASGAVGAILLCLADIAAQRIVPDAEVPVGIVTAVLGAPFLIALMRRA